MVQPWEEFSYLDRPEVLQFIFYPRKDFSREPRTDNVMVCAIPVDNDVSISCRFYFSNDKSPNILFFHGNGEIASDYDDIGIIYNQLGINLFVADYRGYGMSGGSPKLSDVVRDAHVIFEGFKRVLGEKGFSGKFFIMGRSLGSISAIELTCHYQSQFSGLIVESGFASINNLFKSLALPVGAISLNGEESSTGLQIIRKISIPTLIIHGEYDHLVPVQQGKTIYDNVATEDKQLLIIPGVDHNTIFFGGMEQYLQTLKDFVSAYS